MKKNKIMIDPRNARKHGERNKETIRASLEKCGAGRSIVVDNENVIIAGNGVYEQARELGIKPRIIETDGRELVVIKRTDMTNDDNRRKLLALADNRTAELAEWNESELESIIKELAGLEKISLDNIGFNDADIASICPDMASNIDECVDAEPQIDRAEKLNGKWKVKAGDLWLIGDHRLLCGNSTKPEDVARCLDGVVPVLMVTNPPYGVNYDATWRF